jgi:hypothetical protein
MYRSCVCVALASSLVLSGVTPTMAHVACRPTLTFKEVRFSKAQNQLRTWTGLLSVDATRCATTSGPFEITFVRLKEIGPDLLFTERFTWRSGLIQVSLDFWWDESVGDFWIGDVPPCGCATDR